MTDVEIVARALAEQFHEIYERLAPSFGYETRKETQQFDPSTPNGRLMIAVCGEMARERAAALAAATPLIEARAQRETIDALNQPGSMQVNMLRGTINPMPLRDCLHLHGITAKKHWGALTIDEAIEIADAAAIRKGRP